VKWRLAAALFWLASGVSHFLRPKFYKSIVPPPLDRWKGPVNGAAGVAELTGGAWLTWAGTRSG
jgi:uncharacterized membrane protein